MTKLLNYNNNYHASSLSKEKGFTLIELAIVILIGGVLLSFMGSALLAYMKKSQISETQFRMEKIKEAMAQYLSVNGRYPCAASRVLGPENTNFGREVTTTCNTGTFSPATSRNSGVRIGAVPTRSLNLSDEFIADAWGHKFTYAITENLATPGIDGAGQLFYQADGGRIEIVDGAGLSLVNPAGEAHYVIISHGRTGDGSYPIAAANAPSVPCPSPANALDDENCDNDNRFVATLVNSEANTTNFYDDYAIFKGQTAPVLVIPENAVLPFNLSACPPGWSEFEDTTPPIPVQFPARGRFIIGAQSGTKTMPRYQLPPADSTLVNDAVLDLTAGQAADGDAESITPPYVALLYCQKD